METLSEKVEKIGDKWCVVHCHGEKAGQTIACHDSKEKAEAQHRAIQAGKHSQSFEQKLVLTSVMGQTIFSEAEDKRPPKDWWDDCVRGVKASGGAEDPDAVCGNLWYNIKGGKENLDLTLEALKEINCKGCKFKENKV